MAMQWTQLGIWPKPFEGIDYKANMYNKKYVLSVPIFKETEGISGSLIDVANWSDYTVVLYSKAGDLKVYLGLATHNSIIESSLVSIATVGAEGLSFQLTDIFAINSSQFYISYYYETAYNESTGIASYSGEYARLITINDYAIYNTDWEVSSSTLTLSVSSAIALTGTFNFDKTHDSTDYVDLDIGNTQFDIGLWRNRYVYNSNYDITSDTYYWNGIYRNSVSTIALHSTGWTTLCSANPSADTQFCGTYNDGYTITYYQDRRNSAGDTTGYTGGFCHRLGGIRSSLRNTITSNLSGYTSNGLKGDNYSIEGLGIKNKITDELYTNEELISNFDHLNCLTLELSNMSISNTTGSTPLKTTVLVDNDIITVKLYASPKINTSNYFFRYNPIQNIFSRVERNFNNSSKDIYISTDVYNKTSILNQLKEKILINFPNTNYDTYVLDETSVKIQYYKTRPFLWRKLSEETLYPKYPYEVTIDYKVKRTTSTGNTYLISQTEFLNAYCLLFQIIDNNNTLSATYLGRINMIRDNLLIGTEHEDYLINSKGPYGISYNNMHFIT